MANKFPYNAWIVTSSMAIKEITLVDQRWGNPYWHKVESGRAYSVTYDLYKDRAAAIAAAEKKLAEQEARLKRSQESLAKRRATLEKAKSVKAAKPAAPEKRTKTAA
jgi:hypothetical protein